MVHAIFHPARPRGGVEVPPRAVLAQLDGLGARFRAVGSRRAERAHVLALVAVESSGWAQSALTCAVSVGEGSHRAHSAVRREYAPFHRDERPGLALPALGHAGEVPVRTRRAWQTERLTRELVVEPDGAVDARRRRLLTRVGVERPRRAHDALGHGLLVAVLAGRAEDALTGARRGSRAHRASSALRRGRRLFDG